MKRYVIPFFIGLLISPSIAYMSTSSVPGSILGLVAPFTGATTGVQGTSGSVPTPAAGKQTAFLRGDATFAGASTVSTGAPAGVITGSIGDLYADSSTNLFYIKLTGSNTNTGWSTAVPAFVPASVGPTYPVTGTVAPTGTNSGAATDYMSVAIPSAGTWLVTYSVRGSTNATLNSGISFALYDNSNVLQANSEVKSAFVNSITNIQSTGTGTYVLTTVGAATFKVRVWAESVVGGQALSDSNGRSYVFALRIS